MMGRDNDDTDEITRRLDANARVIPGLCGNAERHPAHLREDHHGWRCHGAKTNIWNDWPQGLPVVKTQPASAPASIFNYGRMAALGVLAWTRTETMPEEARSLLHARELRTGGMAYVSHILAPVAGQDFRKGPRNLLAIVHPIDRRDMFTVELGCAHRIVEKVLSNCYYEHTCSICGYQFRVDSGD